MFTSQKLTLAVAMIGSVGLIGCTNSGVAGSAAMSSGSERLTWGGEPATFESANGSMGAGGVSAQAVTVNLNLGSVATLAPPLVGGVSVYATDVKTSGTKVYVSYNTPSASYGGGIDVIDVQTPSAPVLTSSLQSPLIDFSQLLVSGGSLYAAGATDTGLADSAVVLKYPLLSGNLTGAAPIQAVLPGHVGLSVVADATRLYAASGNAGGLSILNPADLLTMHAPALVDGARDLRLNAAGKVAVLTSKTLTNDPVVKTYDVDGTLLSTSAALAGSVIDEGKSTISSGSLFHLVTAGVGGTNLICQSTGVVTRIANPVVAGLTAEQTAANAAVFSNGLLFIANGGAGIYVYSVEQNNILSVDCNVTPRYQGKISFADGTSVNNVLVNSGYLIAATGAGGFKIVSLGLTVSLGLLPYL